MTADAETGTSNGHAPPPATDGVTTVDPQRVLGVLARTHPDAVTAATWQVAYEDLAIQRKRESALLRRQLAEARGETPPVPPDEPVPANASEAPPPAGS